MFLFKLLSFNHFCLKTVCNTRFPKMFWNFDFQICFGLSLIIPTSLAVLHLLPRGSLNPHPEPGLIGCLEAHAPWWYWDIKDPVIEAADLSFYLLQLLIFFCFLSFISLYATCQASGCPCVWDLSLFLALGDFLILLLALTHLSM